MTDLRKLTEAEIGDIITSQLADHNGEYAADHWLSKLCDMALDSLTLTARLAEMEAKLEAKLPCDVHLPPATIIRVGCSVKTLLSDIETRRPIAFLEKNNDTEK
jgi:hypothetical protein